MYYSVPDRGWAYFLFSLVAFFVYNETMAYYLHRLFHNPWLYKKIHKMHHRYHQPTAWSAVAMHPLEFIMYQGYLAATPFLVPIHACKLKWKEQYTSRRKVSKPYFSISHGEVTMMFYHLEYRRKRKNNTSNVVMFNYFFLEIAYITSVKLYKRMGFQWAILVILSFFQSPSCLCCFIPTTTDSATIPESRWAPSGHGNRIPISMTTTTSKNHNE